jgi:hypothetical protein
MRVHVHTVAVDAADRVASKLALPVVTRWDRPPTLNISYGHSGPISFRPVVRASDSDQSMAI